VKCLASRSSIAGVFDTIDTLLNPKQAADAWVSDQRAALSGDIAAQRAVFVRDLRAVASDATTEAAYKFAIAGVVAFGVSFVVYKLATRGAR
jgi:hypothetical protein